MDLVQRQNIDKESYDHTKKMLVQMNDIIISDKKGDVQEVQKQ